MTCGALITSGGRGTRMGGPVPKQYLTLNGVPILARTLSVFAEHPQIDRIVITVPPEHETFCRNTIVKPLDLKKTVAIVVGGSDRQASVYNGLVMLDDTEVVAIHDGVRPLVASSIITQVLHAALHAGAAIACVPIRETVKRKTDSSLQTIPREDLWLAHTPQAFRTALIRECHERALAEGFRGTDDSCLVERIGHRVLIVSDFDDNIKITTPADLERAAFLLNQKGQQCLA